MARRSEAVSWSEAAVRDLESIARHIAADSPTNARRVMARLKARAEDLPHLPERGRVVPDLARFGIVAYREVIVRPYRIIYRFHRAEVRVLAVIDGRRDVEELLFDRLADTRP